MELGVSTLYCCTHGPTTLLGTVQGIRSMSEGNGGLLAVQMLQEDNAILGLEKVNSFLQSQQLFICLTIETEENNKLASPVYEGSVWQLTNTQRTCSATLNEFIREINFFFEPYITQSFFT